MDDIKRFADADALFSGAAETVYAQAKEAIAARGRFSFVLSGGSTPAGLYRCLASNTDFPWAQTHVFFGDERCVAPDDDNSNYRMARETLLDAIALPAEQLHRMPANEGTPSSAAHAYEASLRAFFGDAKPAFDCLLLGMGGDGHTASIFPDSAALQVNDRWVVDVPPPSTAAPAVPRITLTFPIINQARNILFLIRGAAKITIMDEIIAGRDESPAYPTARVAPEAATWFVTE